MKAAKNWKVEKLTISNFTKWYTYVIKTWNITYIDISVTDFFFKKITYVPTQQTLHSHICPRDLMYKIVLPQLSRSYGAASFSTRRPSQSWISKGCGRNCRSILLIWSWKYNASILIYVAVYHCLPERVSANVSSVPIFFQTHVVLGTSDIQMAFVVRARREYVGLTVQQKQS